MADSMKPRSHEVTDGYQRAPARAMLQGVTSFQEDATPTCDFPQSSSVMPTARSIARAGAR